MLRLLGSRALVAGGLTIALIALMVVILLGPLIFWFAWNVLNLASAVGLPELGFWGIVLATVFLVVSWFGKVLITAIVFLVDPSWFNASAEVRWPEPTFRNFVAVALSRAARHAAAPRMRHGTPAAPGACNYLARLNQPADSHLPFAWYRDEERGRRERAPDLRALLATGAARRGHGTWLYLATDAGVVPILVTRDRDSSPARS